MPEVFAACISSYDDAELTAFVSKVCSANKDAISSARVILVKPNLLAAAKPERAVTTHPAVLSALLSVLKGMTEAEILVGDSPGANFGAYEKVLTETGIGEVCRQHGVTIVRVEEFPPVTKGEFTYSTLADRADLIINLPKLKTHSLTTLTMAVKNLFGLVPGSGKVGFHRIYPNDRDLATAIYRFSSLFLPKTISILDGVLGMEGDGPNNGTPRTYGLMAASTDAVAMDVAVTKALGFAPDDCLTSAAAFADGYVCEYTLTGEFPPLSGRVKLPMARRVVPVPEFLKKFVAGKVYVKPYIMREKCVKCALCMKSCPAGAIEKKGKEFVVLPRMCVECFCCHEVCESDAIELRRSFLHKVMVQ